MEKQIHITVSIFIQHNNNNKYFAQLLIVIGNLVVKA